MVALFTAAIYCMPRRTLEVGTACLAGAATFPWIFHRPGIEYYVGNLTVGVVATVLAVGAGAFVRARRELVLSLHERNRQLQAEQQHRVAEARRAERTRIAREMHDVLAHRISLLSVHAGALEFHPDASPEEIARAAQVIRVAARGAQEELREILGVLRAASPEDATGSPQEIQPPQPTMDDLHALVQESREAGMEVRLGIALEPGQLPPTLGRTVYRLVQEALTNARKHASGQAVEIVVVGVPRTGLRVTVTNQPAATPPERVGGRPGEDRPAGHVGSGAGLIGVRERVALVGGQLEHAPLPGGGFRLHATLPWPAP